MTTMPPKIEQAQAKGTLMQECGLLIDRAMLQEHYDAFILECFRYFWYFLNACFSSILFCSSKGAWIDSTFWIQSPFHHSSRVPIVNRHVHYASVMFKEYSDIFY
jgi:hypothetical protein